VPLSKANRGIAAVCERQHQPGDMAEAVAETLQRHPEILLLQVAAQL
jgi:hypothetical protein